MKSALITGGGGGIGAAIAAIAAREGFRVCVVDQDADRARAIAALLSNALGVACDVTDEHAVDALFDRVTREFGAAPDLVVNNAGIGRFGPLIDLSIDDFRSVVGVNLVASYIVARAAARRMRERGSGVIVNITSINSIVPGPNAGAYPAAKAGLARLTEQMAIEWGPLGIRVNAVAPGFIDVGISAPFFANPVVRELRANAVPTKRLGTADDVAEAVLFLASDQASYINGHELVVDGGVVSSLLAHLPRVVTQLANEETPKK